jgi:hypothetical protein
MYVRQHGSKPTLALWMLVAAVDVGIFLGAAGPLTALLIGTALVLVAAAIIAVRLAQRRDAIASLLLPPRRTAPKPRTMASLLPLPRRAAPKPRTMASLLMLSRRAGPRPNTMASLLMLSQRAAPGPKTMARRRA